MSKSVVFPFANGPAEVKAGDKVYLVSPHRSAYNSEVEISAIGRKYLVLDKGNYAFYIDTGLQKTNYAKCRLFSSKAAYDIWSQEQAVVRQVQYKLRDIDLTYSQAIAIKDMLGIKL